MHVYIYIYINIYIYIYIVAIFSGITEDEIDLQYKAIEIYQEWSKTCDENSSHIPISFKYGPILTLLLKKDVYFRQNSLSTALQMCLQMLTLRYNTKNLSSNKNGIRHDCCDEHLRKLVITLTLHLESTVTYTTTVKGLKF